MHRTFWTGKHRIALAAALVLCLAAPGNAQAGGETLKRATGNIVMAPLDLVLSPVVAGKTLYRNLTEIDDTTAVRVAYAVPGYVFLTGLQLGAGAIRMVAGLIEFLPGLGLVFTDSEMDPLYDPVEKSEALVDFDTPVLHFKFGVDYSGSAVY